MVAMGSRCWCQQHPRCQQLAIWIVAGMLCPLVPTGMFSLPCVLG